MENCYQVRKIDLKNVEGRRIQVRVPGSKSITNRALLLAMLSDGACLLKGALFSDDSRYLQQCIADLGFALRAEEEKETIWIEGQGGRIPKKEASVYVGSAGTAARFLTALLGMQEGIWHLDASEQMRRRPMEPLLRTLEEMGVKVAYEGEEGHFPFTLISPKTEKEWVRINIDHSSQFLSALLIAAGSGRRRLSIEVEGSHGMAYIDMTLRMMEQFGVTAQRMQGGFCVGGTADRGTDREGYLHRTYEIEPDVSAACYFYGMAALLGIEGLVEGVHFDSLQGDVEFLKILERMGCRLQESREGIRLSGPKGGRLKGITADMHACSDQAITLAAIAPYASSPVRITGIGHIRLQESDRLSGIAQALAAVGIRCEEKADEITIFPGVPTPGKIKTYDDHRMAMGFSLTGLRADGIEIEDPLCCRKTFETYFEVFDRVTEELLS